MRPALTVAGAGRAGHDRTDLMDTTVERMNNYVHTGRQYYLGLQYSL